MCTALDACFSDNTQTAHTRGHVAGVCCRDSFPRVTSPFLQKFLLRGQNCDLRDSQWRVFIGFRYLVAGKVCKSSAQDARLKMGAFCSHFMTHEFKPAEFPAACCGDKIPFPQQNFIAKTRMSHICYTRKTVAATCPRNMSPQHVPTTCPVVCAGLYSMFRCLLCF